MNRKIGMAGSAICTLTVFLFAAFIIADFILGGFFVCILLALGFMCMIAALDAECKDNTKAAGHTALIFSGVYATLIMIVYYTQCSTVVNEDLSSDISKVLDYSHMGLMFNLDMLGYGLMALSTFFIGLTINAKNKIDKALKAMLMLHGLFFPGCLILPMTGLFLESNNSAPSFSGGDLALVIWCAFFLPIGILSFIHFEKKTSFITS